MPHACAQRGGTEAAGGAPCTVAGLAGRLRGVAFGVGTLAPPEPPPPPPPAPAPRPAAGGPAGAGAARAGGGRGGAAWQGVARQGVERGIEEDGGGRRAAPQALDVAEPGGTVPAEAKPARAVGVAGAPFRQRAEAEDLQVAVFAISPSRLPSLECRVY
jgi:hypothetical protein